jgi:hypothetical protein
MPQQPNDGDAENVIETIHSIFFILSHSFFIWMEIKFFCK